MRKLFSGRAQRSHHMRINGGESLAIGNDETILEAALRASLPVPHLCRVGACGTCLCNVVEGKAKSLIDRSYVLTDDELRRNGYLACQTLACSDIEIEWAMKKQSSSLVARVHRTVKLTSRIWRVVIEVSGVLEMRSGQFVVLKRDSCDSWERPYSVVRSQVTGDRTFVEIDVARQASGIASMWLTADANKGDELLVDGPYGESHADDSHRPLVALGAGSGIGAAHGVIAEIEIRQPARWSALLIFARSPGDVYGLDGELIDGDVPRCVYAWTEEQTPSDPRFMRGRVTEGLRERLRLLEAKSWGDYTQCIDWEYRLFGPQSFIDAALAQLGLIGVHPNRIRFDSYSPMAPEVLPNRNPTNVARLENADVSLY